MSVYSEVHYTATSYEESFSSTKEIVVSEFSTVKELYENAAEIIGQEVRDSHGNMCHIFIDKMELK